MDLNALLTFGIPALAIGVLVWRKMHLPTVHANRVTKTITNVLDRVKTPTDWITAVIDQSIHLIVIGATGGGKTTLLYEIARNLIARNIQVIVLDPDATIDDWEGSYVYGAGDDFNDMLRAIDYIWDVIHVRREERAGGIRQFEPLYVIMDEYADIQAECTGVGRLTENLLRRARKLDIHLIIGVGDTQVRTIGFERKSELLKHATIVDVSKVGNDRIATINNTQHTIPHLTHNALHTVKRKNPLHTSQTYQTSDRIGRPQNAVLPHQNAVSTVSTKNDPQHTTSLYPLIVEGDTIAVVELLARMGWANGKIQSIIKMDNTQLRRVANAARENENG